VRSGGGTSASWSLAFAANGCFQFSSVTAVGRVPPAASENLTAGMGPEPAAEARKGSASLSRSA